MFLFLSIVQNSYACNFYNAEISSSRILMWEKWERHWTIQRISTLAGMSQSCLKGTVKCLTGILGAQLRWYSKMQTKDLPFMVSQSCPAPIVSPQKLLPRWQAVLLSTDVQVVHCIRMLHPKRPHPQCSDVLSYERVPVWVWRSQTFWQDLKQQSPHWHIRPCTCSWEGMDLQVPWHICVHMVMPWDCHSISALWGLIPTLSLTQNLMCHFSWGLR